MQFQIPSESIRIREQLFPYLREHYDCKIINSAEDIERNRTLVFSAPFDNYLQQAIKKPTISTSFISTMAT